MRLGREGNTHCLTFTLQSSPPKPQKICGLSSTSAIASGFVQVHPDGRGLLYGVLPDSGGGVLVAPPGSQGPDGQVVRAASPLDKTFPLVTYAYDTPASALQQPFRLALLDAGLQNPLSPSFDYEVASLVEGDLSQQFRSR
jgi:hypothetical protein